MTNKLVSIQDVKRALKLRGLTGKIIASMILGVSGLSKVNKKYARISSHYGRDFSGAALMEFGISFEIDEKELEYIPPDGPFIITSNHPFGGAEGLILLYIIGSLRPDIKFLTNFMLSHIPNLKEFCLPVNPFSDNPELAKSYGGLKMAIEHLKKGKALMLFPAGEVSTTYGGSLTVEDKEWQSSVIKLVNNANVPVVPVYIHGSNSRIFHYIGRIHPMLRTLILPRELLNKRGKTIKVRIGKSISQNEIGDYKNVKELGRFLRARSYALEANILLSAKKSGHNGGSEAMVNIALPKNRRALQKEINALSADKLLFTNGNYSCYLTDSASIPLMMHELGRRREEAFRAVGEGTGKPLDLDEYDEYYKHLILWDRQKTRLVGAYRLGFGNEILPKKGVKGFYSQSLFNYKKPFHKILAQTIELGRSFVVVDYQREAFPLMFLIKGLFYSVLHNRNVKYLMGPVSISSWYPVFYRSLMIYYIRKMYSAKEFENDVIPRMPFSPDYLRSDPRYLIGDRVDSIEKFDRYMLRLSNGKYRLPTLVKKYLKINSRIINFNVDPEFNYCVDGLVLLDIAKASQSEIEALAKGEKDWNKVRERFGFPE
jgi:Putative hemolysin